MLARRQYKNYLNIHHTPDPKERRLNLIKESIGKGTPFPKPVVYEDLDKAFKKWVEEELQISFEGKNLQTMTLFSNQRFSEYMQSWEYTDENNNPLLNFKTVNRENNPNFGKDQGNNYNIPGEPFFLMARQVAHEPSGRMYFLDYKMRQPFTVDLVYKVNIITNKYELINDFNMMVVNKFKSRQCYLQINGHYMPMLIEGISDESEYNVNDRRFYNQCFTITLQAYIIRPEDMRVEETPVMALRFLGDHETQRKKMISLVPDMDCPKDEDNKYYETITIEFDNCSEDKVTFNTKDNHFVCYFYDAGDNISYFKVSINDGEWLRYEKECPDGFKLDLPENSKIKIRVRRYNYLKSGFLVFYAFDPGKGNDFDECDPKEIIGKDLIENEKE